MQKRKLNLTLTTVRDLYDNEMHAIVGGLSRPGISPAPAPSPGFAPGDDSGPSTGVPPSSPGGTGTTAHGSTGGTQASG